MSICQGCATGLLRQQLEDAQLEAEDWERQYVEACGESKNVGQGRAQIIADLRESISKLEQQKSAEAAVRRDYFARLERERNAQLANTDLTRSLAASERSNEELREKLMKSASVASQHKLLGSISLPSSADENGGSGLSGGNGADSAFRRLAIAEEALETERERIQSLERELKMVRHELSLAKTTTETVERRMALTLAEKDAVAKELQHELEKLRAASSDGVGGGSDAGKQELRDQLQVLTERVLRFQGTIEQLTSQRVMLQQQCVELRAEAIALPTPVAVDSET